MGFVVFLGKSLAGAGRLAQQILAGVDRKSGNADAREREMIGAVIGAGERPRIGRDGES